MVTPESLRDHWRRLSGFDGPAPRVPGLRAHQVEGAAVLAERLRTWRCAVLADPVGTGKSYTALGVIDLVAGRATIVCPSTLKPQWSALLASRDVDAEVITDSLLSRRQVESDARGPVIVDEGHRFRTVTTRRRANLLRLTGFRPVLWLTATPVWNTRRDLLTLVRATVGESLFERAIGTSLERSFETIDSDDGLWSAVCERFVLRRELGASNVRARECCAARVVPRSVAERVIAAAPRAMVFPGEPATLYQQGVARSLASSAEAARATLRRGAAFLSRLEEAQRSGGSISRAEFSAAFGAELGGPAQCVMPFWFLPGEIHVPDLAVRQATLMSALAELNRSSFVESEKGRLLCRAASSATKGLIFTEFQATAEAIWNALPASRRPVLVTGRIARVRGVGEVSRAEAFALFRNGEPRLGLAPELLVLTPVGAEGLNLQCADTVIHADLAWNEARMEQRVGRADRIGGVGHVSIVTFRPPPEVEEHCKAERLLSRKARLARISPSPSAAHFPSEAGSELRRWNRTDRFVVRVGEEGRLIVGEGEFRARSSPGSVAAPTDILMKLFEGGRCRASFLPPRPNPPVRVPRFWLERMRKLEVAGRLGDLRELLSRLEFALTECGDAGLVAVESGMLPKEVPRAVT